MRRIQIIRESHAAPIVHVLPMKPERSFGKRGTARSVRWALGITTWALLLAVGCRQPRVDRFQTHETLATPPDRAKTNAPTDAPSDASRNTDTETSGRDRPGDTDYSLPQPDRWLVIKKAVNVESGTFAKGDFNAARNKISIATKNVAEFTIDTDRIPIDWSRAVIISIDGINAELRHRNYSPLLFRREGYSSWSVVEP